MKKHFFIAVFILFFAVTLFPQNLHELKQKRDSILPFKEKLHELFQDSIRAGVESDYIYLILLPPGMCPRCEGLITPSIEQIKKYDSTSKIIIAASYPRMSSLIKYLAEHGLNADAFWLTEGESSEILDDFCFTTGFMQVPYLTKINVNSGLMVYSASYLGMYLNDSLIRQIVESSDSPDFIIEQCPGEEKRNIREELHESVLFPSDSILLIDTVAGIPSGITDMKINQGASSFVFHDRLTLEILNYEKISNHRAVLRTILKPGEKEKQLFIDRDMTESVLLFLEHAGMLRSMYFNAEFSGIEKILISASLPYVFMEDEETVSYYNEAVILEKDIISGEIDKVLRIDIDKSGEFAVDHTKFIMSAGDSIFLLPVQKGFPNVGTVMELTPNDTIQNPFVDGFYKNAPLFQRYVLHSEHLEPQDFIGEIDSIYRNYHLGYSFVTPFYMEFGDTVLMSSGNSGTLRLYLDDKLLTTLQVFNVEIDSSAINFDRKKVDPLEYIMSFSDFFDKRIVDAEILGDNLFVLTKDNKSYYLKRFNKMRPMNNSYYLPERMGSMKLKVAKFNSDRGNSLRIYAVYESSRESKIYMFSIPAEN